MSDEEGGRFSRLRIPKIGIIIAAVIILIAVIAIGIASVRQVEAGHVGIKTIWGAVDGQRNADGTVISYNRPLQPGIQFVSPISDNVILWDTRVQIYNLDISGASKDIQNVFATIGVTYHVDGDLAPELYDKVGTNIGEKLFKNAIESIPKTVLPKYTAEEIVQKRPLVVIDIDTFLRDRLQVRGVIIDYIDVVNVDFEPEFVDAIEAKVVALQKALQAENQVKVSEAEAKQRIADAEGRRQSAILDAQGQAESIRLINDQLLNSPQYIEYLEVTKWDGKLPTFMGGENVPFIVDITENVQVPQ